MSGEQGTNEELYIDSSILERHWYKNKYIQWLQKKNGFVYFQGLEKNAYLIENKMRARAWSLDIMKDNTSQEEYFG